MMTALIGFLGILLGIVLNEQLRRRNRIENYSTIVFERRLGLYEELHRRVCNYSGVATEVIENDDLTKEQRHELVSDALHEVAIFTDEHELYINEEIALHCIAILMGVEDIYYVEDEDEKKQKIKCFQDDLLAARLMIRKETGIADIEKLYHSIIKPKHSSSVIEYFHKIKKEQETKGK
jgi:hypothetical protein